jgi:hypothetical protein
LPGPYGYSQYSDRLFDNQALSFPLDEVKDLRRPYKLQGRWSFKVKEELILINLCRFTCTNLWQKKYSIFFVIRDLAVDLNQFSWSENIYVKNGSRSLIPSLIKLDGISAQNK